MKRTLIVAAAMATLALNAPAVFCARRWRPGRPGRSRHHLRPGTRTRVREYVTRERVAPVTVKERIAVGTYGCQLTSKAPVCPRRNWGHPRFRNTGTSTPNDRRVFCVEPSTREIIYEVD